MAGSEITVDIIDRFQRSYPVDIFGMAKALDISVLARDLPDNVSGKIEADTPEGYFITVNANHGPNRQRFTVAHEIAHYVLHRHLIGDGITDNALYRDDRIGEPRERQANRYAATLLMPRPLVEKAWRNGVNDYNALAAAFEVSPAVAEIRWRELGCALWKRPTA
jgi:Zn-dependent peptidase ImmA (M78 family)